MPWLLRGGNDEDLLLDGRQVLHRPSWLPVPSLALQLALGELGTLMTTGQRVDPARREPGGYAFRYPTLEPALRRLSARASTA